MPIEKIASVTQFLKKCACCGRVLNFVKKMSASWYECRNQDCLVWKLERQAIRMEQARADVFLDKVRKRNEGTP